jgi:glycerophosphoryl diester phosphodiesterase
MAEKKETAARPAGRALPEWLTKRPIAHRGLHALPDAPENSLAAFAAAARAGFPIELDVQLLADGQVAVFHDHLLERLTGAAGLIAERRAEEIRPLRLHGTDEPIPLLGDVLAAVAGRVPLLIEIKSDPADPASVGPLEAATLDALAGYAGEFAIQSFSPATVAYLAARAPRVIRGQLASGDGWSTRAGGVPLDFLGYALPSLPTALSSDLRAQGAALLAWTVKTPDDRQRANTVADNFIFEATGRPGEDFG